jgi:tetratricopeptide (TPR) repeat protein
LQMEFKMKSLRFFRIIFLVVAVVAFAPCVAAQQGGQGGNTGDSGNSKPPPKVSPRPEIFAPQPDYRKPQRPEPPLIFISGKVEREDGSPPPFGAVIELDCGGSVTRQTTVNTTGSFWFQVGDANRFSHAMPDASEGLSDDPFSRGQAAWNETDSGMWPGTPLAAPEKRLAGCDLRVQLHGYRSSSLRFELEPEAGQNDMGTLVLYPIQRVPGTTISATNLLAPKKAKKLLKNAKKAVKKERFNEAEQHLKSAITAYPEYGEAWFELGALYQGQKRNKDARDAYMKAIDADKLFVNPYIRLGWLASTEHKWQEAADFSEHALDLDPVTFPEAYFLNALANCQLNNLEIAEKSARQLQRLDPQHRFPKIFLVLSNIYALRRNDAASIEEMRNYLKYAPKASDADTIRALLDEKISRR